MDVIVRTTVKGIFPFVLLFGIFIIIHGHLSPGGSFPGGSVVVAGIALVMLAFGLKKAERIIKEDSAHMFEGIMALFLIFLVFFEMFIRDMLVPTGSAFAVWSGQQILLLNVFGGIMVMMALISILFLIMKE